MEEQDNYFSPNHRRLLAVATWAKYLAWGGFIFYILASFSTYIQTGTYFSLYNASNQNHDFIQYMKDNPIYGTSVLVEILEVFTRGFVYYLVLHAVSLGLNMIIETDVNYRDRKKGKNE